MIEISRGRCSPACRRVNRIFQPGAEYPFQRMMDKDFGVRWVRVGIFGAYQTFGEEEFDGDFFVLIEIACGGITAEGADEFFSECG